MTPEPDWRRWERQLDPRRPDGDTLRAGWRELVTTLHWCVGQLRLAIGLAIIGHDPRTRPSRTEPRARVDEDRR